MFSQLPVNCWTWMQSPFPVVAVGKTHYITQPVHATDKTGLCRYPTPLEICLEGSVIRRGISESWQNDNALLTPKSQEDVIQAGRPVVGHLDKTRSTELTAALRSRGTATRRATCPQTRRRTSRAALFFLRVASAAGRVLTVRILFKPIMQPSCQPGADRTIRSKLGNDLIPFSQIAASWRYLHLTRRTVQIIRPVI